MADVEEADVLKTVAAVEFWVLWRFVRLNEEEMDVIVGEAEVKVDVIVGEEELLLQKEVGDGSELSNLLATNVGRDVELVAVSSKSDVANGSTQFKLRGELGRSESTK